MKILVVSHEFPPIGGGGANACYFLTKGMAERGNEISVITANFDNLPEHEKKNDVDIYRVNSKRANKEHSSFKEMLDYLKKALPLAKKLQKKNRYDLCWVFFGIPSGPIGYVLKKKYKLPYIIRFGGGDVPGFQERFTKVYKLIGPAIKAIWRNADALVANSTGLKKMALDYYSKKDFEVIYNGVDTDFFCPLEKGKKEECRILFASRLIERKGLQFIIPKLKDIDKKTSGKIKLIVVGDGPYREELELLTKSNDVEDMVEFAGQKSREEIVSYYQNADIFILPSKKEGMPNVVLEAMACGLPVVMTPCQGAAELINGNGYIADIGDFSEKMIELINDDLLLNKMGEMSRKLSVEKFGWNNAVDSYMKIIKKRGE